MFPEAAVARANANVALVKYWGKRDPALNLPATGSISLTLDGLAVEARVAFASAASDRFVLDEAPARGEEAARLARFFDLVREEAGRHERVDVVTRSAVPRGIGLASSAAAFAALALAGSRAAGLRLEPPALSALARRGSGSAARSIFGGFVEWRAGKTHDESHAVQIAPQQSFDHFRHLATALLVAALSPRVTLRRARGCIPQNAECNLGPSACPRISSYSIRATILTYALDRRV